MTTTSPFGRAGVTVCALATIAALAVTGCGGGSGGKSDGSAATKSYEATVNAFCSSIKGAATQVQKDATAIQSGSTKDPKKAVKALSGALATFADTTSTALDKLRGVKAPSAYADFHAKAVKGFDSVVAKLREAAAGAKSGNLQAITALGASLNSIKLPDPPKELKAKAPACRDISQ